MVNIWRASRYTKSNFTPDLRNRNLNSVQSNVIFLRFHFVVSTYSQYLKKLIRFPVNFVCFSNHVYLESAYTCIIFGCLALMLNYSWQQRQCRQFKKHKKTNTLTHRRWNMIKAENGKCNLIRDNYSLVNVHLN